ncbi:3-isopropylmalate dehydratase [Prauserella sp. PE36]|uniref:LeuD/DmdB family oxidoreductase small subunit n=1 Tax=Prauserella sp. PE36 TaxID=1504709 RepID=UPI000D9B3CB7|nr:3-isopropylmalate dehydratase [Prauserella sp. PE36]PXY23216.1 3-isopropylmalate dehydratase [Prauserella coralliicola]RBM18809.1 3-isopropylmalate dehydratase [Prauserella sp. PE36]
MTSPLRVRGRAWVFGDEINTDDMYPGFAMKLPVPEAAQHMFDATRPGWPALVEPGDIVVAGKNFGLGSSRACAELFVHLGISCLVAEQYNSLFHRNALNYGLPALTVPDARTLIDEGDVLEIDAVKGLLRNEKRGTEHHIEPLPAFVVELIAGGGLINRLEADGFLDRNDATSTTGGKP